MPDVQCTYRRWSSQDTYVEIKVKGPYQSQVVGRTYHSNRNTKRIETIVFCKLAKSSSLSPTDMEMLLSSLFISTLSLRFLYRLIILQEAERANGGHPLCSRFQGRKIFRLQNQLFHRKSALFPAACRSIIQRD